MLYLLNLVSKQQVSLLLSGSELVLIEVYKVEFQEQWFEQSREMYVSMVTINIPVFLSANLHFYKYNWYTRVVA